LQRYAKEIVAGDDLITLKPHAATLHYGLKKNHPRNVAIVHPMMYLFRRIIFTLAVLLLDKTDVVGTMCIFVCTIAMLVYAIHERQWNNPLHNQQHIVNEVFTYYTCIAFLFFTSIHTPFQRLVHGWVLLALFVLFVVYNLVMIIMQVKFIIKSFYKKYKGKKAKYLCHLLKIELKNFLIKARICLGFRTTRKPKTVDLEVIRLYDSDEELELEIKKAEESDSDEEEKRNRWCPGRGKSSKKAHESGLDDLKDV
jgi:hypothetical protein